MNLNTLCPSKDAKGAVTPINAEIVVRFGALKVCNGVFDGQISGSSPGSRSCSIEMCFLDCG